MEVVLKCQANVYIRMTSFRISLITRLLCIQLCHTQNSKVNIPHGNDIYMLDIFKILKVSPQAPPRDAKNALNSVRNMTHFFADIYRNEIFI